VLLKLFRSDGLHIVVHADQHGRPHEHIERQRVHTGAAVEEMLWRIDVRARVRPERERGHVRAAAFRDRLLRLDANLGVAWIDHAAIRDRK